MDDETPAPIMDREYQMSRLLTGGIAALFYLTAMAATANAFDYSTDDEGGTDDAADFAYEMGAGGYRELQEGFENGEFNPPFDDVDESDDQEDEDDEEDEDEDE
jgi:hypothetical protein